MAQTNGGRLADWVLAAGAGMLLMYFLDRQQGRRRVALVRDKAVRLARKGADLADAGARDLAHRAAGTAAALRGELQREPVDDAVLVDRVRSKMGRWTSRPHAIQVNASAGHVTLSGAVPHSEHQYLLREVARVHGVREVEDRLEVHRDVDGMQPPLQRGRGRPGPRPELMQSNWSAGPRLLVAGGGAALAVYGLGRRGPGGMLLALLGAGLATRAVTNLELTQILGTSGGHRAVDIEKAIHIAAPRETVFDIWSNPENFPHFMSNVEEVRPLDNQRTHWVVKGPAGSHLEWDSVVTECVRPKVLAWRTEAGAPVQHAGSVRFEDERDGTRVAVRMSYNPPGGAVGHAVAKVLGRDPKVEMDEDLMRMKAFIELKRPPHDAARMDGPSDRS